MIDDDLADLPCLCTALRGAAHRATLLYDDALKPLGISVTMFRLMRRIDALEVPTLTNLASAMGLDRSTLGRNVRVLEKQQLVTLHQGDDSRTAIVRLTEVGHRMLEDGAPLWRNAQRQMTDALGPDRAILLRALERVGAAAALELATTGGSGR